MLATGRHSSEGRNGINLGHQTCQDKCGARKWVLTVVSGFQNHVEKADQGIEEEGEVQSERAEPRYLMCQAAVIILCLAEAA